MCPGNLFPPEAFIDVVPLLSQQSFQEWDFEDKGLGWPLNEWGSTSKATETSSLKVTLTIARPNSQFHS